MHQAAGKAPEPHKGLRDKLGSLLTDATDIEGRWVEHYTELLSAQAMTEEPTGRGEYCETFEPSLTVEFEDKLKRVNKLNPRKASGTDWITAELLQANGGHTARHIKSIGRTMVSSVKWASQLAGAWIANIFKKKGDEQEVDAWRGVQVGSQVVKVLTDWLQPHIAPQLRKFAGPDQYAGPPQGTTIANHTLRSFNMWQCCRSGRRQLCTLI